MEKITKWLLAIFLLIVIIKVLLSAFIPSISAFGDEYAYAKTAWSLFHQGQFNLYGNLVGKYPPLYSLVLSLAYVFDDMNYVYFSMKLINCILSSLIIFPAWLLAKQFLNNRNALLAAALVSIFPSNFAFAPYLMAENLFYPLFLFAIYALYRAFDEKGYKWHMVAAVISGLAMLTKITGFLLVLIAFGMSVCRFVKERTCLLLYLKQAAVFVLVFSIVICPWLVRNGLVFGFNLSGLFGSYTTAGLSVPLAQQIPRLVFWFLLYISYLLVSTGFIFPIGMMNMAFDKKYRHFVFISLLAIGTALLLSAYHDSLGFVMNPLFDWIVGRPIGRYMDFVSPLIIIAGVIGLQKKELRLKKSVLFASVGFTALGFFLTIFSLFPVNNISLTLLGAVGEGAKILLGLTPLTLFIVSGILLLALFAAVYILSQRSYRMSILVMILFFLITGVLAYGVSYYNASTFWMGDQTEMGIFMNEYDPGHSIILIDARDGSAFSKYNQTGIYEYYEELEDFIGPSIIGFWLNDEIVIGDPEAFGGDLDYIYTKHTLNKTLVKQIADFRIYSANQ